VYIPICGWMLVLFAIVLPFGNAVAATTAIPVGRQPIAIPISFPRASERAESLGVAHIPLTDRRATGATNVGAFAATLAFAGAFTIVLEPEGVKVGHPRRLLNEKVA